MFEGFRQKFDQWKIYSIKNGSNCKNAHLSACGPSNNGRLLWAPIKILDEEEFRRYLEFRHFFVFYMIVLDVGQVTWWENKNKMLNEIAELTQISQWRVCHSERCNSLLEQLNNDETSHCWFDTITVSVTALWRWSAFAEGQTKTKAHVCRMTAVAHLFFVRFEWLSLAVKLLMLPIRIHLRPWEGQLDRYQVEGLCWQTASLLSSFLGYKGTWHYS